MGDCATADMYAAERHVNRPRDDRTERIGPLEGSSPRIDFPVLTAAGIAVVEVDRPAEAEYIHVELREDGVYADGEKAADWCDLEEQARESYRMGRRNEAKRLRGQARAREDRAFALARAANRARSEEDAEMLEEMHDEQMRRVRELRHRAEHLEEITETGGDDGEA